MSKSEKFGISFFTQLNNLEERFLQQKLEKDDLDKLIAFIGELVQHYDLKKDFIKFYFIEKMQFILSRPYTLQVLKGETKQKPEKVSHKHNFSLPVLRIEKQAQVQTDLNESIGKIKQLQEDFEQQQRDQDVLIQRELDNQINEVKRKIQHRKRKSNFCPDELKSPFHLSVDESQDTLSPLQKSS